MAENNRTTVRFLTTALLNKVNNDTRTNDDPSKQVTNESVANVTSVPSLKRTSLENKSTTIYNENNHTGKFIEKTTPFPSLNETVTHSINVSTNINSFEGHTSSISPYNSTTIHGSSKNGYFFTNSNSNETENSTVNKEFYHNTTSTLSHTTQSYTEVDNTTLSSSRLNKSITTPNYKFIQNSTITRQNKTYLKTTNNPLFTFNNTQTTINFSTEFNKSSKISDRSTRLSAQVTPKNPITNSNITNSNTSTSIPYLDKNNSRTSLNSTLTSAISKLFNTTVGTRQSLVNYTNITEKNYNITKSIMHPTIPSISNKSFTRQQTDKPDITKPGRIISTVSLPEMAKEFNYTDKINSSITTTRINTSDKFSNSSQTSKPLMNTITKHQITTTITNILKTTESLKQNVTLSTTKESNSDKSIRENLSTVTDTVKRTTNKEIFNRFSTSLKTAINSTLTTEMLHPTIPISRSIRTDFENSTRLISTSKPGNVTIDYLQTTKNQEIKTVKTSSTKITTIDNLNTSEVKREQSSTITPLTYNKLSSSITMNDKITVTNNVATKKNYSQNATPEQTTFSYNTKTDDKMSKTSTASVNKLQTTNFINFTTPLKNDYSTKSLNYFTSQKKTTIKNKLTSSAKTPKQEIVNETHAASLTTTKINNENNSINYQTTIKENLKVTAPILNNQSTETTETITNHFVRAKNNVTVPNSAKNSNIVTKSPPKPTNGQNNLQTLTIIVIALLNNENSDTIKQKDFLNSIIIGKQNYLFFLKP